MTTQEFDQTRTLTLRDDLSKSLSKKYKELMNKIIRIIEKENPRTLTQIDALFPKFGKEFRKLEPTMQNIITRAVRQSFMKGTNFAEKNISRTTKQKVKLPFTLKNKRALENVKKMSFADVKNIDNDIKNYLRRGMYESIDKNEGINGMTERIKAMSGRFSRKDLETFQKGLKFNPNYRAKLIARTSIIKAYNEAALEQYKQSGVAKQKEWLTGIDERVCPWCNQLQGTKKNLNENFVSVHKGKKMTAQTPPLHPNCRCVLISVV